MAATVFVAVSLGTAVEGEEESEAAVEKSVGVPADPKMFET